MDDLRVNRCDACPVDPAVECWAQASGHARFCKHVEAGRADFIRMLREVSGRTRVETIQPRPSPGPPDDETLRAVERCPSRDCLGCGCSGCWCELARRRVGIRECVLCREAREPD